MNTTKEHSKWLLALLLLAAGLAGAMMPQTAAADENGPIGSSGLSYSYTTADKTRMISHGKITKARSRLSSSETA